jgi:hypothetical protein
VAYSKQDILQHPGLVRQIRLQSAKLLSMFESDARLAAVFATQQRWLMSHAGLSLHFRIDTESRFPGLHLTSFLDTVQKHGIASRNTADAYIKEMIKYKYVTVVPSREDKRVRFLEPTEPVIAIYSGWLMVHLASLDGLYGGNRLQSFTENPKLVAKLQPDIADALISARTVRAPTGTFSLFTWLDNGGLIMDKLIAQMDETVDSDGRIASGEVSTVSMAAMLGLSRTHLARKLREAEEMGSIGWMGRRGHSVMWVSPGFRAEYLDAQAIKLSIIDQACENVMGAQPA